MKEIAKIILIPLLFASSVAHADIVPSGKAGVANLYQEEQQLKGLLDKFKNSKNITKQRQDALKVAREFQDILASQFVQTMMSNIDPNPLTGGGSAERMYRSLIQEEYAKNLDLGMVESIADQIMSKAKGEKSNGTTGNTGYR